MIIDTASGKDAAMEILKKTVVEARHKLMDKTIVVDTFHTAKITTNIATSEMQ